MSALASSRISTLNEKALHAALKGGYARPGDRFEVEVDGYLVDIVRGDTLIEIQTANFTSMKRKLLRLVPRHRVHLVHPIPREKWIVRLAKDSDSVLGRRRSPKRGSVEMVFEELVGIPTLITGENFSLEVLFTQEEEVRRKNGVHRAWRRKGWVIEERRLLDVVERRVFQTPDDLAALVPQDIDNPFTTADLADALGIDRALAQRMAYCLREMGAIRAIGKCRNAILYTCASV